MSDINWENTSKLRSKSYQCGYCGKKLASEKGYFAMYIQISVIFGTIYICHFCNKPTFIDQGGEQIPGVILGDDISSIDDENVEVLYNEARKCTSTGAYTAVVLCCRKLLMHIAVAKGAVTGKNFVEYIQFLSDKNYVPPNGKEWVDQIREKGNEANHEIVILDKETAEDLLNFSGMLLKFIYEFPSKVKKNKK